MGIFSTQSEINLILMETNIVYADRNFSDIILNFSMSDGINNINIEFF